MADVVERLNAEHRVIEQVLGALETAAEREVPLAFYRDALRFLREYADGCHHAKEEEQLFPAMEARGLPAEGPTAVMREEHRIGRAYLARLAAHLESGNLAGLRGESLGYAALMRDHIYKEDEILFPMALSVLGPEDLARLAGGFDAADRPLERRSELEALAGRLRAQVADALGAGPAPSGAARPPGP